MSSQIDRYHRQIDRYLDFDPWTSTEEYKIRNCKPGFKISNWLDLGCMCVCLCLCNSLWSVLFESETLSPMGWNSMRRVGR
ncbi:hypothetical protein BofuT4_uP085280.1 [Botrytis cinerea T4]|uniref:Uncharacterized protein n=1 Tax=Botryotinia fuckeliana (strain T4) TaxID=999810 RepID=G2YHH9_BOTF4|nr:hypothetical protein BofuT4_uP085280.1 [Botrytis cinerea T4]